MSALAIELHERETHVERLSEKLEADLDLAQVGGVPSWESELDLNQVGGGHGSGVAAYFAHWNLMLNCNHPLGANRDLHALQLVREQRLRRP